MPWINVESVDFKRWELFEEIDEEFLKTVSMLQIVDLYNSRRALMVTLDGRVWGVGDVMVPCFPKWQEKLFKPVEIENLSGIRIKNICHGEEHILILTKEGQVLAFGNNLSGQCGVAGGPDSVEEATIVGGLPEIKDIAVGMNHSLALTTSGQVYCWGNGWKMESWNSCTATHMTPELIAFPDNASAIISITAGMACNYALTEDGWVYGWGSNTLGELCLPWDVEESIKPVRIEGLPQIIKLSSGTCNGWALSSDGDIFGWGNNEYDWMGLENKDYPALVPSRVMNISKALDVTGLWYEDCSCAQTTDGFFRWSLDDKRGGTVPTEKINCKNIAETLKNNTPCVRINYQGD